MNKEKFIEELTKETSYDKEKCILINDILENNFIIGKKKKEQIINDLKIQLSLNDQDAEHIYEVSMNIISKGLKEKIKHPFRSQD